MHAYVMNVLAHKHIEMCAACKGELKIKFWSKPTKKKFTETPQYLVHVHTGENGIILCLVGYYRHSHHFWQKFGLKSIKKRPEIEDVRQNEQDCERIVLKEIIIIIHTVHERNNTYPF